MWFGIPAGIIYCACRAFRNSPFSDTSLTSECAARCLTLLSILLGHALNIYLASLTAMGEISAKEFSRIISRLRHMLHHYESEAEFLSLDV
jgi:hypothetical protein